VHFQIDEQSSTLTRIYLRSGHVVTNSNGVFPSVAPRQIHKEPKHRCQRERVSVGKTCFVIMKIKIKTI